MKFWRLHFERMKLLGNEKAADMYQAVYVFRCENSRENAQLLQVNSAKVFIFWLERRVRHAKGGRKTVDG